MSVAEKIPLVLEILIVLWFFVAPPAEASNRERE
jgi:hypothetical protein